MIVTSSGSVSPSTLDQIIFSEIISDNIAQHQIMEEADIKTEPGEGTM